MNARRIFDSKDKDGSIDYADSKKAGLQLAANLLRPEP